jgi:hypothetical protein
MKTDQEYIKDLSEIRQMMQKSTKFLSLAGWSGIMAGIYALAGAYVIFRQSGAGAEEIFYNDLSNAGLPNGIFKAIVIASVVLLLAVSTCIFLSYKKAQKNNEVLWNATTRRLVLNMAIPLVAGGVFILMLISKGMFELMAPLTLIFYGLSLVNASRFTFDELRYMGIFEIILGLLSTYFNGYNLLFWSLGFGILHIIYGNYMHWRYER